LSGDAANLYAMEIIIEACARIDDLQSLTITASYHLNSLCRLQKRRSQKPFRLNIRSALNKLNEETIICLGDFKQLHTLDIRNCGYDFVESISSVISANDNINTLIYICDRVRPIAMNPNIRSIKCAHICAPTYIQCPQFHTIEFNGTTDIDSMVHKQIMNALELNTTLLVSKSLSLMDSSSNIILHRNNMIAMPNVARVLTDLALIFINILPLYVLVEVFDWISPYYYTHVHMKTKIELVLRIYEYCHKLGK
jgi:hypothetical protein